MRGVSTGVTRTRIRVKRPTPELWWKVPGGLACPYADCRKHVSREKADEHLAVCRKRNTGRLAKTKEGEKNEP